MPPERPRLFPAFAGVALADILANSVAIVIIMIVVTLMVRYEQEQEKLEQTEDVSVVLSRELASSFVMNALPTSPPSQLHDYQTWPPDRNPQHAAMPIIELHDDHVRDYYTGAAYYREELLRNDNAFDAYLESLAPEQLQATRVDVYGIGQFYIAMSIFKQHGLRPRHWHFLESVPGRRPGALPGGGAGDAERDGDERLRWDAPERTGDGRDPDSSGEEGALATALPEDVALAAAGGVDMHYPDDIHQLLDTSGPGRPQEEHFNLPGGTQQPPGQGEGDEDGQRSAPRSSGDPSAGRGGGSPNPNTRYRAATANGREIVLPPEELVPTFPLLRGLFAFMAEVQQAADAGQPSVLPRYNFLRDVLRRIPTLPPPTEAESNLLRSIAFLMDTPRRRGDSRLPLRVQAAPEGSGQALAVFPNEPLLGARWLRDAAQPPPFTEGPVAATFRLGAHAEIHEGLRIPLSRNAMLLMPPPKFGEPVARGRPDAPPAAEELPPRWRVATLIDPDRADFVTGFIYAGMDADGRLLLPVDENAIDFDGRRLESLRPSVAMRGEAQRMVFYGFIAVLFAAGIVGRYSLRPRAEGGGAAAAAAAAA